MLNVQPVINILFSFIFYIPALLLFQDSRKNVKKKPLSITAYTKGKMQFYSAFTFNILRLLHEL